MWGKKNNISKTVHLDIKGGLPEQARKPRDGGRDDFIEIRTDSPVCTSDSLVGRAMPWEAAYILFSHPTGKTFNSGKHLKLMERRGQVHCLSTGGRSTAYSVFAAYSGTVTLGNLFSRIKSTSMEVFKFILNLVVIAKI